MRRGARLELDEMQHDPVGLATVAQESQAFCKHRASTAMPMFCQPKSICRRPNCSERAFRRNTAERMYTIEVAHNTEVAGSNPAPATEKGPRKRGARIGEFVGQRDLNVTANTHTHVLMDEGELDYAGLL